jgi:hypothetical protein
MRFALAFTALLATAVAPIPAHAHFVLEEPISMFEQNVLGEPSREEPCGAGESAVETNVRTSFVAGATIEVTIHETIFTPGHYRVALALEEPADLPPPPIVTPTATPCGTAVIQDPPVFPVLADGVLAHTSAFEGPQTVSVTLPDVTCESCTLQVLQFESMRVPPCFHYHCAAIRIPEPEARAIAGAGLLATFLLRALRRARRIERA